MKTPRHSHFLLIAVLCALMLAPLACRRAQAPGETAPALQTAGPAPPSPQAPAPREPVELTVPAGTILGLEFGSPIASDTVAAGSVFEATITNDVYVSRALAIPAGTTVHGTVTEAVPAKKIGGQARLTLSFDHLKFATDEAIPIAATLVFEAKKQSSTDAATIGGSAAGGAVLGNLIDRRNRTRGTVLGTIIGEAVGTTIAAKSPGEEVIIPAGSVLQIRLTAPVKVPAD